jgi:pyridoxine 5-phosphate synthase
LTRLLINIDHVATLRNARQEAFPDPVLAAKACEMGGADGIVFHLREDRRHINDEDVRRLKEAVSSKLDFELSLAPDVVDVCCGITPELATLVPERRQEITTEGGLDVVASRDRIAPVIQQLRDSGVQEVALFLDPVAEQVDAAAEVGAMAVELHTGDYANALEVEEKNAELTRLAKAAVRAHDNGLTVHAGHGLDYDNFVAFAEAVPHVVEVSIGFAIIARSLFVGIEAAVSQMQRLIETTDGHSLAD